MARWSVARVRSRLVFPALGAFALPGVAAAQQWNVEWAEFERDDSRLVAPAELGSADTEEKDYAWGDLDQDGWTDLVVVRKQPFTTPGKRVNVLLMNEGGTLVDRTTMYATATTVANDVGFMTKTNDRDVVLVDVDLDGWLDIVTCTTLSNNTSKAVSHPRVYMNQGNDAQGNWIGLVYEEHRFPQLQIVNGPDSWPRFCEVAAGDVTGDGYPDLYFVDYDQGCCGGGDLNDRLLINDGTGVFVDESTARMTTQMLQSDFGVACAIEDMNGDGLADIVKDNGLTGYRVSVAYNDPNNVGYFNLYQSMLPGAPYHVSVGDLNNDNRPDLVTSDDAQDRLIYNLGNDSLGRVVWGPPRLFHFVTGGDQGFDMQSLIVDLDQDGWNDVIMCDVDVDIPGCVRRTHIYHNPGGTPGDEIHLIEEAGDAAHGDWRGVVGMTVSDLEHVYDAAVFDIDNDGHLDIVFGRCGTTDVWMNTKLDPIGTSYCGPAVSNSSGGPAEITALGSAIVADDELRLEVTGLPAGQPGYFLASQTQGFVANPGGSQGNLCLGGNLARLLPPVLVSDAAGEYALDLDVGNVPAIGAILPGETWNFQSWFRDMNPGSTSNFTDGVGVAFQ